MNQDIEGQHLKLETAINLKKEIRDANRELIAAESKKQQLESVCKHDFVIILRTKYKGSYSWDYDDWHDECRMCLCCGLTELGDTFHKLKNPIARFEFSTNTLVDQQFMSSPLSSYGVCFEEAEFEIILEWVLKNGMCV